jgi:hypothetical protein
MDPVVSWIRLYSSDVGQQSQERIAQEIVSVRPDPRRHAAQRTAALAGGMKNLSQIGGHRRASRIDHSDRPPDRPYRYD